MARLPSAVRSSSPPKVASRNAGDLLVEVHARTRDQIIGRVLDTNGKIPIDELPAKDGMVTIDLATANQMASFYLSREKYPDYAQRLAAANEEIGDRPDLLALKGLFVRKDHAPSIVRAEACKLLPSREGDPPQLVSKRMRTILSDSSKALLQRADVHFAIKKVSKTREGLVATMVDSHDLRPVSIEALEELGQVETHGLGGALMPGDSYRGFLTVLSETEVDPQIMAEISWLPHDEDAEFYGTQLSGAEAFLNQKIEPRNYRSLSAVLGALKRPISFPPDLPKHMKEMGQEIYDNVAKGEYKVGIAQAQHCHTAKFYREAAEDPAAHPNSPVHKFMQAGYMRGVANISAPGNQVIPNDGAAFQGNRTSVLLSFTPDRWVPEPDAAISLKTLAAEAMARGEDRGLVYTTAPPASAPQAEVAPEPSPQSSNDNENDFGPNF